MDPTDFDKPQLLCDLVMKGGVTSGVVYPLAVCELARRYSFKNIGGTSAGAIAAAATAAAEYNRRNNGGSGVGYVALSKLPQELADNGRLLRLFKPHRNLRQLFDIATSALAVRSTPGKIARIAWQLLRSFVWAAMIIGTTAAAASYWFLGDVSGALAGTYVVAVTSLVAVTVFLLCAATVLYRQLTLRLPDNFYGMVTGFDEQIDAATADAPLTNWLTHYFNDLAGKPLSEGPLTFGDLYSAARAPGEDPRDEAHEYRGINLEMMTTALNHGRPYRLPFHDPNQLFYFSSRELRKLFPQAIVDYMVANPRPGARPAPMTESGERLHRFPEPENVPVVVATRMSLSFPFLLSAVPLYAMDQTRKTPKVERCWFSDGGICSNLPLHFFDASIPRWPTFGINLKPFHPDHLGEENAVHLSKSANHTVQVMWNRFESATGVGRLTSFVFAIIDTMQSWRDNAQARVPGYRDRLVHISQAADEGGLNLRMMSETINGLSERGRRAGIKLVERFAGTGTERGPGWDEHRWVRMRSTMALTVDWVRRTVRASRGALPGDASFEVLLMRDGNTPPDIYRIADGSQVRARETMNGIESLTTGWQAGVGGLDVGPKPTPELRITPKL
jgi:predicted acylesterase/phospholipase RssA